MLLIKALGKVGDNMLLRLLDDVNLYPTGNLGSRRAN